MVEMTYAIACGVCCEKHHAHVRKNLLTVFSWALSLFVCPVLSLTDWMHEHMNSHSIVLVAIWNGRSEAVPDSLSEALNSSVVCLKSFPNIATTFHILSVLPIATIERANSALKHLNDRLNALFFLLYMRACLWYAVTVPILFQFMKLATSYV